MHKTQCELDKL